MLELKGVVRRFGEITAVDHVDLEVPPGSMVGFVGGNGAGKTSTMRIAMGLLAADAGEVRWQGEPITRAVRSRFGYMPEERGLYPKQPALDQLVYLGRLHGMDAEQARTQATALLERLGLGDRLRTKVESLSLGNQQRAQIIAAVLGDPLALILDEPFSGLDPAAVDAMSDLLREHTAAGVPVLFSSHQLDLVERLCDAVVVLHAGRVVARGTPDELRASAPERYRLVLDGDAGWVRGLADLDVVDLDGPSVLVAPLAPGATQRLLREALDRGEVRDFHRVVPSLSEIYREVAA